MTEEPITYEELENVLGDALNALARVKLNLVTAERAISQSDAALVRLREASRDVLVMFESDPARNGEVITEAEFLGKAAHLKNVLLEPIGASAAAVKEGAVREIMDAVPGGSFEAGWCFLAWNRETFFK